MAETGERYHLSDFLFVLLSLSILGILIAAIVNFTKKRIGQGVTNTILLLVCAGASGLAFLTVVFSAAFGPSEDGFADELVIPADIEVAEPAKFDLAKGTISDAYKDVLVGAVEDFPEGDSTITAEISAVTALAEKHPDLLQRYLAASPAWRVFEEGGKRFATRRMVIGPMWKYKLHGYYTGHDLSNWNEGNRLLQTRLTFGFSGSPWARADKASTILAPGETGKVRVSAGVSVQESHTVIRGDRILVEIFEQSAGEERQLTKASLTYLQKKLTPLLDDPTWETAKVLLDSEAMVKGAPSINLVDGFQPGIYDTQIRVNPGESGTIYLKAFEVSKETPLSAGRLYDKSNERVGWSDDPAELFLSNTNITIYEGDWGKPYAARFELWFIPDSGEDERKLLERVFKIEGWQR
ncbi:MAG: hypothetical protein CMO55_06595 [Verrucomicrobiales bacterium]|nr:hypothetical protein [Verrucomicrobiales bacterium]